VSAFQRSRSPFAPDWDTAAPVNAKAMLKAGDLLFIAGTPNEFPKDDIYRAVEGRAGGVLVAASAADGKTMKQYRLGSRPAWDGMAAAKRRLVLSLTSGHVQCWGAR
jgi:hypothetical protein